jgi:hypothetical protein
MPNFTGEVSQQDFLYVEYNARKRGLGTPLDLPENVFKQCCFILDVFGSISDSDTYKNDKSDFLYRFPLSVTSCVLNLQKRISGVWTDQVTLDDSSYGTFSAFGFARKDNKDLIGYYLDWRIVLSVFGVGNYRVKRTFSSTDLYSNEYCLHTYTPMQVDRTVRIRYIENSIVGDMDDTRYTKDFSGLNRENMIRIPDSFFGFTESSYELESVRYDNGFEKDYKNEQTQRWTMEIAALPSIIHNLLRDEILQSDELFISDYNSLNNITNIVELPVVVEGDYKPIYSGLAFYYPVTVQFKNRFNNKRKLFC